MFGRIYAIALNTFREAIRRRVIYGITAVVIGFNFFAMVLGEMSLNEEARVARDVALSGISLFGAMTAIVFGVLLLHGEIEKRTIHTIICKPLARWEFVLGKYLGIVFTLTVLVAVFAMVLQVLLSFQSVEFSSVVIKAVVLAYMEVLIVAAIAMLFSAFSTPFLSGIFTFGMFFMGRITPEMRAAVESSSSTVIKRVCEAALYLVPDLHLLSISGGTVEGKHVSVHTDFVSWGYVMGSSLYALIYIAVLLLVSIAIFSRRDFV